MAQDKAKFEEIGRIKVSPTTDVVVSNVIHTDGEVAGVNINNFVTTERYTGYTKGVFIPSGDVANLVKIINQKWVC